MTVAVQRLQQSAVLILSICLAFLVVKTWAWPLISDATLMHYVVFLEQHQMAPYRQIVDVNMPGSYIVDSAVTRLLGTGPHGFRLFDYLLMLTSGISMVALAKSRTIIPGLLAALLFAVLHIGDGVAQEGQRDFIMAVLLLLGFVWLFAAVRRCSAFYLFLFGAACGVSATIKPQAALLGLLLTPAAACLSYQQGKLPMRMLVCGWTGLIVPPAAVLTWLWRIHALGAFVHISLGLSVYHAGMARHSLHFLLAHAMPSQLLPIAAIAMALTFLTHGWRRWQEQFCLAGIGFGFFSFCLQGKAYPYHRYPLIAFLLLFAAMEVCNVLELVSGNAHAYKLQKGLAWSLLGYAVLWLAPAATAKALRYDWRSQPSLDQLQLDLQQVSSKPLDKEVQCMDTMAGCITVLDRMQLVQATGFLYDCYFFAPRPSAVKQEMQDRFLAEIQRSRPSIFIVTDQWCLNLPGGYRKLAEWPQFASFLSTKYTLALERTPSPWDHRYRATWPFGYRIYIRKEWGW